MFAFAPQIRGLLCITNAIVKLHRKSLRTCGHFLH